MLEVRERRCREHYGDEIWGEAEPQAKACFDFLCGNHTRNLPVVRFNKVPLPTRTSVSHTTRLRLLPIRPTRRGSKQN
jgi:hypothetical protein